MSQFDSTPSSRPLLVSLTHAVLKAVGSLLLTVAILTALIAILLWGTVVEKNYGDTAAKFGIYGSWWFNALGLLLGLNAAAALILRWPWKWQHLGFIIPHIGLIVLLVGCYLSRHYGIEATLSVFEGDSSDLAYKGSEQHVELDGQQQFHLQVIAADGREKSGEAIVVPFTSGPFNWDDYHDGTLAPLPWSLVHRDRGVLYDRDGIRLEVLDYLSNSAIVNIPSLEVHATPLGPDGHKLPEQAKALGFAVKPDLGLHSSGLRYGVGSEQTLADNVRILFWMTGSAAETAAFRQSKPQGPLGKLGRVVLHAGGKSYDWPLSDWKPGSRRALGDAGLEAELVSANVERFDVDEGVVVDPRVHFNIHQGSNSHPLVLSAEFPEIFSRQDYDDKVFGTYWTGLPDKPSNDPKTKADAAPAYGPPRVDFLQGADQELYLRTWRAGEVSIKGPLKMDENDGTVTLFRDTPDAVALRFGDFLPAPRPGFSARAVGFDKNDDRARLRQAYVRLTVDGQSDEFWMPCSSPNPVEKKDLAIPEKLEHKTVAGKGRRVELSFAPESFHLGYSVCLHKAWRKLDPGTRQPSFYGSEIDLVPSGAWAQTPSAASPNRQAPAYENLLVTLNAPLDFADPACPGRSYRMFQSTMPGPYNPEQFDLKPGESVYLSGFRLNYDPGRGLTYVGCLLIVAGIFVAYFVRLARNSAQAAEAPVGVQVTVLENQ